jgi:hypothetical protein
MGPNQDLVREDSDECRLTVMTGGEEIVLLTEENVMLRNPAQDGALAQIKTITAHLPPPDTKRWVPRRKAAIAGAVRNGAIGLEEVCRRYELSVEEFLTWQRTIETRGVPGLRVTLLQIYRDAPVVHPGSGAMQRRAAEIGKFR